MSLLLNVHVLPNASGRRERASPGKSKELPLTQPASLAATTRNPQKTLASATIDSLGTEDAEEKKRPSTKLVHSFVADKEDPAEASRPRLFDNKKLLRVLGIVFEYYMSKDVRAQGSRHKVSQEWFLKMMQNFKLCPQLCPKMLLRT